MSTDVIVAVDNKFDSDFKFYDLYDVYNPATLLGGDLNVTFFGTWNQTDSLQVALTQRKIPRRSNLHLLKLRAVFLVSKP